MPYFGGICAKYLDMKKIAVVVPNGETMSSAVVAPYVIFNKVNEWLVAMGKDAVFEVQLVGCDKSTSLDGGTLQVQTHCLLSNAKGFDLAIVPGFTADAAQMLAGNQALVQWLSHQREEHGMELASLCSGAFYVAATGLADGKKMTTHWAYEAEFRAMFPKVKLLAERIVTDDSGIYASGGAYSSLNLILYLLEKFSGPDAAQWAWRIFQIDPHRRSQKPFAIFNNQKAHIDESVAEVQEFMEQNFQQGLTVNELARQFGFSRRNFLRRFKEATGNPPLEYLQRIRIEAAKRLLERSAKSVEEIVSASGYSDSKTFRMLFKKHTGFSPLAYRGRYRQA